MLDSELDWLVDSVTPDTILGAASALGLTVVFAWLLWRRRRVRTTKPDSWSLNQVIVRWSEREALTLANAFEGVFIGGGTGSGKTSGSGYAIAEGCLRTGAGGLVCTAKPDDTALWRKLCHDTGRSRDLVVFGPGHGFNFTRYEAERAGVGAGLVENQVDLLNIGCEIADRGGARSGRRAGGWSFLEERPAASMPQRGHCA